MQPHYGTVSPLLLMLLVASLPLLLSSPRPLFRDSAGMPLRHPRRHRARHVTRGTRAHECRLPRDRPGNERPCRRRRRHSRRRQRQRRRERRLKKLLKKPGRGADEGAVMEDVCEHGGEVVRGGWIKGFYYV